MSYLKKLLCMVLCPVLIACAMGGCSLKGRDSSAIPSQPEVSGTVSQTGDRPYKIGLIQYGEQPSLNTIREAFMSRLEEWAYDEDKVQINYQNADGDEKKAEEICRKFIEDGTDMIVAVSDPAVKTAVEAVKGTEVKVLFASESDPKKDLGISDLQKPEGNVTGTANSSSVKAVIDLAFQADPGLKVLGLFYNPDEPVSKAQAEEAKKYCGEKGIETAETAVAKDSKAEDAVKAATELCKKAGAVFTPLDGAVSALAPELAKAFRQAQKPWYAGEETLVQNGALAAASIDYTELGYQTADMAVELMAGKAVSQVPVAVFDSFQVYINQTALDAVKTVFPEETLASANFLMDAAGQ